MAPQAFALFALQLFVFALVAFPRRTLIDSMRVALGRPGSAVDAPEMAVGVFGTLGRASLITGVNGAFLAMAYCAVFMPEAQRFTAGLSLCAAFVIYGISFRVLVALPLEALALLRAYTPADHKNIG